MARVGSILLIVAALAAGGCTSYYVIKDPASGQTYYTTEYEEMKGGAVKLQDEKTGATVTLQNSAIREVSSDEYKAGLKAPAPAKAAPAAAPAPAPAQAVPAPAPAPAAPAPAPAPAK